MRLAHSSHMMHILAWFDPDTISPRKDIHCLGECIFRFVFVISKIADYYLVYHSTTCSPK